MIAVGGNLEAPLPYGMNAVQLPKLLHALLAPTDTAYQQLLTRAWSALAASRFAVDGLDVLQQCVVA